MDGTSVDDQKLEVTLFKSAAERGIMPGSSSLPKRQFNNLFVKNIPKDFTSEQLAVSFIKFCLELQLTSSVQDVFKEFGEIVSCKVVGEERLLEESKSPESNQGYGFVCFKNANDARQALLRYMESPAEAKSEKAPAVAGTGEQ